MGIPEGEIFPAGSSLLMCAGRGAGGISRAYRPNRRKRCGAFSVRAQHRACGLYIVGAADEQRSPLMQLRGLDIEDSLVSIGCRTTGLLDNERERTRLV